MAELSEFEHDVFISYSHRDGVELAEFLECALADHAGLEVWRDKYEAKYGPELLKTIVLGLERSRTVVAIITPQYLESDWCLGEFFIAAAFNNFFPVLGPGVTFKDIPFDLETSNAALFEQLESNPEEINKFCRNVFERGQELKSRTGFFGRQLPAKAGATIKVLANLERFPFNPLRPNRDKRRLNLATEEMLKTQIPGLRDAFGTFSDPSTVQQGLVEMREALSAVAGHQKEWRILGTLARPFNSVITRYAFSMAGVSDRELIQEEGFSPDEIDPRPKRLRRAARRFRPDQLSVLKTISPLRPIETSSPTARSPAVHNVEVPIKADSKPLSEDSGHTHIAAKHPYNEQRLLQIVVAVIALITSPIALKVGDVPTRSADVVDGGDSVVAGNDSDVELVEAAPDLQSSLEGLSNQIVLPEYCEDSGICEVPLGHTLWKIAEDCYQDGRLWGEVWQRNQESFDPDPNKVWAGQTFRLDADQCLSK